VPYLFSAAFPRAEAPGTRRTPLYELISLPGSETRPPPVYGQLSHASLPSASLLRPAASLTTAPRALPLPPLAPHRTSERLIILPRPKRQPFSEGCHSRVLRRAVEGLLWKRSRRGSRAVEAVPWKPCRGSRAVEVVLWKAPWKGAPWEESRRRWCCGRKVSRQETSNLYGRRQAKENTRASRRQRAGVCGPCRAVVREACRGLLLLRGGPLAEGTLLPWAESLPAVPSGGRAEWVAVPSGRCRELSNEHADRSR